MRGLGASEDNVATVLLIKFVSNLSERSDRLAGQKPPAASSAGNLDDLFKNARRRRITMLPEAFDIPFDCLTDVFGCLYACPALRNTSGQSGAGSNKDAVLVLFQENTELHQSAFYQSRYESDSARDY